jgi:hypothetical protein
MKVSSELPFMNFSNDIVLHCFALKAVLEERACPLAAFGGSKQRCVASG